AGVRELEVEAAAAALAVLRAPVDAPVRLRGRELGSGRVAHELELAEVGRAGIPRRVGRDEPDPVRAGREPGGDPAEDVPAAVPAVAVDGLPVHDERDLRDLREEEAHGELVADAVARAR